MTYFVLPNCLIAHNSRVAGMAIAQAVMQTFYPLFAAVLSNPPDFLRACPTTMVSSGIPAYLLVRNPLDRFISAVGAEDIDVSIAVDGLGKGLELNSHFVPQSSFSVSQSFSYDTGIAAFCAATGLPYPLPTVNKTASPKPTLTADQETIVQQFYAADYVLYNSLAGA